MSRAEARILEAQDDKRLAESQLAQAQQDLVRMREEASVSDDPPPEQVPLCDPNEELQRLRVQVAKIEAEIARHRPSRVSVPSADLIAMDGVSEGPCRDHSVERWAERDAPHGMCRQFQAAWQP